MIESSTPAGTKGLAALIAHPERALVAFDYDGTLAPIVDDPTRAVPHAEVIASLAELGPRVGRLAIVTGRPTKVAVDLAGFADTPGLESLVVLGHYGMERWDAATGGVVSTPAPAGVDAARGQLPALLASLGLADASIEDKGLSVAVHVRRLESPDEAFDRLLPPLQDLAERLGLTAEPGRMVIELRPPGMDKGRALGALADEFDAETLVFVGDDLGDLAAFHEVERRRSEGANGLLVCSGSTEVQALAERADLVVDGPAGVAALVSSLSALLAPVG